MNRRHLLTLEQAFVQNPALLCPQEIMDSLGLMEVRYSGFDGKLHIGQIVVAREVMNEVEAFFDMALELQFPIHKVAPAPLFDWDDEHMMAENITSGFNYRTIAGTKKLSKHALGLAFDVNPMQNPYIRVQNGRKIHEPKGSSWQKTEPGTLHGSHPLVNLMKGFGWTWGGDWDLRKDGRVDYQHFEKSLIIAL